MEKSRPFQPKRLKRCGREFTVRSLEIEDVHGPLFYSDVEEKMLGVITVGGRLSFFHVSRRPIVGDATLLRDAAMRYLKAAVGGST